MSHEDEIIQQIHELDIKVSNLETKFENQFGEHGNFYAGRQEIKKSIADLADLLKTQNGRVTSLETWRSFLTGAWVVVAFIVTYLIAK